MRELLGVAAPDDPFLPHARESLLEVYLDLRVGKRTAGVVDQHRRILLDMGLPFCVLGDSRCEVHFGHSHSDLREQFAAHVVFFSLRVCFLVVWHVVLLV